MKKPWLNEKITNSYLRCSLLCVDWNVAGMLGPLPQNFPRSGESSESPFHITRKSLEQPPRASTSNVSTVRFINLPFGCEMM